MKFPKIILAVGCIAFLMLFVAGPGSRFGVWQFPTGFKLIQYGFFLGIATCVLVLIGAFVARPLRRSAPMLVAALVLGGVAALLPYYILQQAKGIPPIHDVTTDLDDPPSFVAVLPLRANASNPATYGGPEVAAAQRKGYADLAPLELPVPPATAFSRAAAAARGMGWEMVATDSAAGRIEATATTMWFGFKDDVVVRVRPAAAGSRVDVRSVSRVGGSDVGANAHRIRAYLAKLRS